MKKKIVGMINGMLIGMAPFALSACNVSDVNQDIDIRVEDNYVQWQVEGDGTWNNLISIDEILDSVGDDIKGVDGKQVEFGVTSTHIQWRYVGDSEWKNLIALSEIKGEDLKAETCTITYDFNLGAKSENVNVNNQILSIFNKAGFTKTKSVIEGDNLILEMTQKSKKGDFYDLYTFDDIGLKDYFLGWYVGGVEVNPLYTVGGDIELTAKWTKDIATQVNTIKAEYKYFDKNLENTSHYLTASIFPVEEDVYNKWNGVEVFAVKELSIHNGKFYKITEVSPFIGPHLYEENRQPDVGAIVLPDTISEDCLDRLLKWRDVDGKIDYNSVIYDTYNVTGNGENTNYYIGNYVIVPNLDAGMKIRYIFEVDYDKCEAKLVNINTTKKGAIVADPNFSVSFDVLKVNKDGKTYNLKVTSFEGWWLEPMRDIKAFNINKLSFIIGDGVGKIGSLNFVEPFDYDSELYDGNRWEGEDLILNFYSKRSDVDNPVNIDGLTNPNFTNINDGEVIVNLYYYSETEPTDTEHKYWHYNEKGVAVAWENE